MSPGLDYGLWSLRQETGELELDSLRANVGALHVPPTISVLLVAGRLDELWVSEGVQSLADQAYPRWELCVAQYGARSAIDDVLAARLPDETRIHRSDASPAASPEAALARALALATGEFALIVDEGDELSADALLRLVDAIRSTDADLIYTNEDRIDARGGRSDPIFKPGFSPDRLLCSPYLGRLCAMRTSVIRDAGGLEPALGPVAEHDLLLRVTERARRVAHLPQVLYHRRVLADIDGRVVHGLPDPPSSDATIAVVEAALERRGGRAIARAGREFGTARVIRQPPEGSRVSLIVRSDRRRARLPLLDQLQKLSLIRVDEVIVAGERPAREPGLRVVEDPCPARAANRAAREATGDVLIFCGNAATLPPTAGPRWVGELVAQATRPEVGAVSGTVVDAEGRLRHGGVRVDLEGLAGPAPLGSDTELPSTALPFNPGGASADLLAIDRRRFERVGGFDAEHLPVSLYALDLAFRLGELGLISVYTPVAQIQCRDSRTFPSPEEIAYMWSRWSSQIGSLLDYERSPTDPHRSPLAPAFTAHATFPSGAIEASA